MILLASLLITITVSIAINRDSTKINGLTLVLTSVISLASTIIITYILSRNFIIFLTQS